MYRISTIYWVVVYNGAFSVRGRSDRVSFGYIKPRKVVYRIQNTVKLVFELLLVYLSRSKSQMLLLLRGNHYKKTPVPESDTILSIMGTKRPIIYPKITNQ